MQRKKVQVTVEHDGRPLIREGGRAHVRERGSRPSLVADLRSIVSAAQKLPAEVDPPARIWTSLRTRLEKEGILSCSVRKELAPLRTEKEFVGDTKMKTMRRSILCFVVLLLAAPLLRAHDLSRYRHFTIGMSLTRALERTDQKMVDVEVTHGRPALIQEVTWWPPNLPGASFQSDTVEQILLSFYNSQLYKISVTYDRTSTEGLTAADMVKSISAKYGPATNLVLEINVTKNDRYDVRQKPVATWEDAKYSFNLVRSSFFDVLGLVIYSKRLNAEAELAIAEAVKLDKQEGPKREAERQKKQSDDLEATRRKNRKTFRP